MAQPLFCIFVLHYTLRRKRLRMHKICIKNCIKTINIHLLGKIA